MPIGRGCDALGASRSGYYKWRRADPSERTNVVTRLKAKVVAIHTEHAGRYGSPRIHRELRAQGETSSRKRVARLMKSAGIAGYQRRRYRHTTDSNHAHRIAPNLLKRNFTATRPNEIWVGDVTYIPTVEGWLYLAVLVDLFSRRAVGWAMSDRIDTELVLSGLNKACLTRRPPRGLVHHTDRDCRYASDDYRKALRLAGIRPSMSRRADCWDNAVAESFFATLEKEVLSANPIETRLGARQRVAQYIEDYCNLRRRHSYLDYHTPIEYELAAA